MSAARFALEAGRRGHLVLPDAGAAGTVPGESIVDDPTGAKTGLPIGAGASRLVLAAHVRPGHRVGSRDHDDSARPIDHVTGRRIAS